MKIDANDPRWTDYALGELKDERDKAEIESILAESAEMRQLVEDIRHTAGLLTEELKAEPPIALSQAQRSRIESRADAGRRWLGFKPAWALAGVAAILVLTLSISVNRFMRRETVTQRQQSKPATMVASNKQVSPLKLVEPEKIEKPVSSPPQQIPVPPAKPDANAKPEMNLVLAIPEAQKAPPVVQQTEQIAVLRGTVMDESGAVIPGATVKVTDDSTGATAQAKTNPAGQYIFPALSPGEHTVTANLTGFKQATVGALDLKASSQKNLDLTLEVGSVAETVTVSTDAPVLQSEAASVVAGNMLTSQMLPPMPMRMPGYLMVPPGARRHFDDLLPIQRQKGKFNTEAYDYISDNPFQDVAQNPLSTFSIDVDTASYSNVRRFLDSGSLPPKDAIRIEELVNYFDYDYKGPQNDKLFAANFELTEAPWKPEHRLLRIGLKGREMNPDKRPPSNLVFLLDVSGSMADENKLPLVKESMRLLVDQLTESDKVAIVVYASNTALVLPSTSGDQKEKLLQAIGRLVAGGSTNAGSGIQLAYQTAQQNFIQGGVNRVILATDGDFNVGITNRGDLTRLIEEKAKSGVYLSALGFGMGNYKDATLELLAKKGHGNYAYIDTLNEAKKVLVQQIYSTLVTIAKDVKIQVEFNPQRVSAYRLIGYEDRIMPKEDFNDDTKDAGVIGAGHTVTALYELVPAGKPIPIPGVDPLKYQKPGQPSQAAQSNEVLTVKIRCKEPEKDKSNLSEFTVKDSVEKFSEASKDFKFAAAVAAFGMVLRESPHKANATLESALEWAKEGQGTDKNGYRKEFIRLIHRAISLGN